MFLVLRNSILNYETLCEIVDTLTHRMIYCRTRIHKRHSANQFIKTFYEQIVKELLFVQRNDVLKSLGKVRMVSGKKEVLDR